MRYQCYFIAMNYLDSICFWWMRLDLQMGLGHALSMPFILICTKPMYNIHTHTDIYMYIYIYLIQYSLIHNTGTYMHTILYIYTIIHRNHIYTIWIPHDPSIDPSISHVWHQLWSPYWRAPSADRSLQARHLEKKANFLVIQQKNEEHIRTCCFFPWSCLIISWFVFWFDFWHCHMFSWLNTERMGIFNKTEDWNNKTEGGSCMILLWRDDTVSTKVIRGMYGWWTKRQGILCGQFVGI